ncbi:hypothetical protein MPF_0958 [Methanohalophilus portucalensis FDF-1]|uniref:Uncharacterized protein n=1 Tax=Methanohalophilus portucalensis FDF-1 TaxID=523843 RepID=A0A1L9C6M4_9EURY|nr:hypothetical protein MPF_0958 [Methanohalophilus portucalensis FDF-1]
MAPSLVRTMSPMEFTIILSIPLGPRVVLTMFATAFAAAMFTDKASLPCLCSVRGFMM